MELQTLTNGMRNLNDERLARLERKRQDLRVKLRETEGEIADIKADIKEQERKSQPPNCGNCKEQPECGMRGDPCPAYVSEWEPQQEGEKE